jgi:ParB-like chromosome segregation protein Spo0J
MTRQELIDAANDLIKVMQLMDGPKDDQHLVIIPENVTEQSLIKLVKEAIEWIRPDIDVFQENTNMVIKTIQSLSKPQRVKEIPDKSDNVLPSLEDDIKDAERLKDLKEIVITEDIFDEIRDSVNDYKTVDELKTKMLAMMGVKVNVKNAEIGTKETISDTFSQKSMDVTTLIKLSLINDKKPFSELFAINDKTLKEITDSIEKNGFDPAFPIILWDNVIVDGRTRFTASKNLGLIEVPVIHKEFKSEEDAVEYAIHNQRARRNLTDAELLKCIETIDNPMTKKEAGEIGGSISNSEIKIAKTGASHKKTAKVLGIGESKVTDARVVLADKVAVKDVEAGKETISSAAKKIREKKKKEKAVTGKVMDDKGLFRQKIRKLHEEIEVYKRKVVKENYRNINIDACIDRILNEMKLIK